MKMNFHRSVGSTDLSWSPPILYRTYPDCLTITEPIIIDSVVPPAAFIPAFNPVYISVYISVLPFYQNNGPYRTRTEKI